MGAWRGVGTGRVGEPRAQAALMALSVRTHLDLFSPYLCLKPLKPICLQDKVQILQHKNACLAQSDSS